MKKRYDNLLIEIAKLKPKTILEVGTCAGRSAVAMIQEAQKHNADIGYVGFDLFEDITPDLARKEFHVKKGSSMMEAWFKIEKETGIERFDLVAGNTRQTLRDYKLLWPIEFVFLDGGHSPATIASDWGYVKEMLYPGTVVLFDDYYPNRVDYGCKLQIDTTHTIGNDSCEPKYCVELLSPIDEYPGGIVDRIQFAKVTIL